MRVFDDLCPARAPLDGAVGATSRRLRVVRRLEGVPQDAVHHAEGDVATHTRWRRGAGGAARVARAAAGPAGAAVRRGAAARRGEAGLHPPRRRADHRARPLPARRTGRAPDAVGAGRARSRGASTSRRWSATTRCRSGRWSGRSGAIAFRVSLVASNDDLALLATADILGRICADIDKVLDTIALFRRVLRRAGRPRPRRGRSPPTTPGSGTSARPAATPATPRTTTPGHRDRPVRAARVGQGPLDRRPPRRAARGQPRRAARRLG